MSCSQQPGVRVFLDFIERISEETITQTEWHAIRQLTVDAEAGKENSPLKLSRRRVNDSEISAACLNLKGSLHDEVSSGFSEGEPDERVFERVYQEMRENASTQKVTYGTYAAINFLAENGVQETLEKIRAKKTEPETDVAAPQEKKVFEKVTGLNFRYVQCDECGQICRVTIGMDKRIADHGDCPGSLRQVRMNDRFNGYDPVPQRSVPIPSV